MKSVYLNYASNTNEYYLTEEGYAHVRALVMQLRICSVCHQQYDMDAQRPCVGLRICLECFLRKHPTLTFLEMQGFNSEDEYTYAFIDAQGTVYTSRENYSDEPQKDITYTLKQLGFSYPTEYTPFKATETKRLHSSGFSVYGDLLTAPVVVADYNDYYDKTHATFLLYRNAGYKELTKRGEGKVLYEKAQAMLEQTKLKNGSYFINGHEQYKIWEQDIYRVISQLESAIYAIAVQFAPPKKDEPETPLTPDEMDENPLAPGAEETELEPEQPKRGRKPRISIVPEQPETVDSDLDQELEQSSEEATEEPTNAENSEPMQQEEES